MGNKYDAIREKFNDGDWVFGIGEHTGCSQVFDWDTDHPQPFSYLDDADPDNYRVATDEEILLARARLEPDIPRQA